MEKIVINGGKRLTGEVTISGAKNAAVAIIPATLLVKGVCRIENVPDISDVEILVKILYKLGANVKVLSRNTLEIDCSKVQDYEISHEMVRSMRASYYLWGALLGRFKNASVSMPGGCDFGVRPVDQHVRGFEALGAVVSVEHGMIEISA